VDYGGWILSTTDHIVIARSKMTDLEKKVQDYLCWLNNQLLKVSGVEWGNAYYELNSFLVWLREQQCVTKINNE